MHPIAVVITEIIFHVGPLICPVANEYICKITNKQITINITKFAFLSSPLSYNPFNIDPKNPPPKNPSPIVAGNLQSNVAVVKYQNKRVRINPITPNKIPILRATLYCVFTISLFKIIRKSLIVNSEIIETRSNGALI